MSQRNDIVAIAVSQIGYREGSNNDNKFGKWYGTNNQSWCDIFVSWCADQAEINTNIIPKSSYVPNRQSYYEKLGLLKRRGAYTPQAGDLILFDFNGNGICDHVGIVESVSGSVVTTIEGNTNSDGENANGDGVWRKSRKLTYSSIYGYCVPKYKGDEYMEVKTIKVKSLDTGNYIEVEAINVNGHNYIKLRDVENLLPVEIGWDGKSPTMNLKYK